MIKLLPNSTILPIKPFQGPYRGDFYLECTYKKPSNTLKKRPEIRLGRVLLYILEDFLVSNEAWTVNTGANRQTTENIVFLKDFPYYDFFRDVWIRTRRDLTKLLTAAWRDTSSSTWSQAQPARPRTACHCPARGAPGPPGRSVYRPSCCCNNII
jgi:hypothetical protein